MTTTTASQEVENHDLLQVCKATADSMRLDILRVLSQESFAVLELCHIFDSGQPGMSHHLKILAQADLLHTRREGNSIFYRRALINPSDPLFEFKSSLFRSLDTTPLASPIEARREQIHTERGRQSREFFNKNADRLKENQDLIAEFSQYAGCVGDLLSNEQVAKDASIIEVGPGQSDLLGLLARQFDQVLAIDNSQEMLSRTREKAHNEDLANVSFFHGELEDSDHRADLIVFNMVMHHLPSPRQIFENVSSKLNAGGRLLIIDLCPHNQDWASDICGDLWLGFDPKELDDWANRAGLSVGQSVYLGLKNGFQVQVRLYTKP